MSKSFNSGESLLIPYNAFFFFCDYVLTVTNKYYGEAVDFSVHF